LWLTCQSRSNSCRSIRSSQNRGRCLAKSRISQSNRGSSFGRCDWYRWMLRGWSSTRHARRSETNWDPKRQHISAILRRCRSGLTSFPSRLPSKCPCREPGWHHLLQPDILFSQRFEVLFHLPLPATVLLPPTVISLFSDPNQHANFQNFLPIAKLHIRSTQLGDHLVHTMTLLCHLKEFSHYS